jgi:hypothetical protein
MRSASELLDRATATGEIRNDIGPEDLIRTMVLYARSTRLAEERSQASLARRTCGRERLLPSAATAQPFARLTRVCQQTDCALSHRTAARPTHCKVCGKGHFPAGRPALMPMTAEDCYARAAECDKHATMAKRFEMKVQHRELAQQWRYLASEIERIASQRVEDQGSAAVALCGPDVQPTR